MQALGQTAFLGTVVALCKPKCTARSRGMVAVRAVAAPTKLDTRKSEQARASKLPASTSMHACFGNLIACHFTSSQARMSWQLAIE